MLRAVIYTGAIYTHAAYIFPNPSRTDAHVFVCVCVCLCVYSLSLLRVCDLMSAVFITTGQVLGVSVCGLRDFALQCTLCKVLELDFFNVDAIIIIIMCIRQRQKTRAALSACTLKHAFFVLRKKENVVSIPSCTTSHVSYTIIILCLCLCISNAALSQTHSDLTASQAFPSWQKF